MYWIIYYLPIIVESFLSPQVNFSNNRAKCEANRCGVGFNINNNNTLLISLFNKASDRIPFVGTFSSRFVISVNTSKAAV